MRQKRAVIPDRGREAALHVMPKAKTIPPTETYPCVARWLKAHGAIEFGYCRHTRSFIRAFDEGGMIWSGRRSYKSFDTALADCEAGVGRWLREELREQI